MFVIITNAHGAGDSLIIKIRDFGHTRGKMFFPFCRCIVVFSSRCFLEQLYSSLKGRACDAININRAHYVISDCIFNKQFLCHPRSRGNNSCRASQCAIKCTLDIWPDVTDGLLVGHRSFSAFLLCPRVCRQTCALFMPDRLLFAPS